MMLDQTDLEIIKLLKNNARLGWRDIGEHVHLSGQAVGARVARMEKLGAIKGYTIVVDSAQVGLPLRASLQVFMKSLHHPAFTDFVRQSPAITRADRISGEGCYQLIVQVANEAELNQLLDEILKHGNYKLNLSIGVIKE